MEKIRFYVLRGLAVVLVLGTFPQTVWVLTSENVPGQAMMLLVQGLFYWLAYWLWRRAGAQGAARRHEALHVAPEGVLQAHLEIFQIGGLQGIRKRIECRLCELV